MKELVMTIESSKIKEINDLCYVKKDLEIARTENFKLKETVVTDNGQLVFLKEQLQILQNVVQSIGNVKSIQEDEKFKYLILE